MVSRATGTELRVEGAREKAGAKTDRVGKRVGVVRAVGIEDKLSLVDGKREGQGLGVFIYPGIRFGSIEVCGLVAHCSPEEFNMP